MATELLFPRLSRAAQPADEGGPAAQPGARFLQPRLAACADALRARHAGLLDYFDFVSRVNAVVTTARTLSDTLRDPELHKFAAHLLALLHVRIAAAPLVYTLGSITRLRCAHVLT